MATTREIKAGGAFIELYMKGGKVVEEQFEALAKKSQAFAATLTSVSSVVNIASGHVASSIRSTANVVTTTLDSIAKSSQVVVRALTKSLSVAVDTIPKMVKKIGDAIAQFGKSALFAGLGGGGLLAGSMAFFMEYERQMARVMALTNATTKTFKAMTAIVRELGSTTQYTTSQVADGMAYLAMAGLTAQEQMAAIPVVLDLATAAMMNLGETADIVTDIGMAFNYMGNEIQRVADVLAAASTSSNTTIPLMGLSFKYLASFAVAAGQSIEEMASAVALLATTGIKGNTAGTGLREALTQLVTPAKRSKLKASLGIDIADQYGNVKPLLDLIGEIRIAMANLRQDTQLELMTQIFGKRGGNVMLSLMHRTNEEIQDMRDNMLMADGAAKRMADTMRNSLWGTWQEFVSVLEDVSIEIGHALVPAVQSFLKNVTKAVGGINEFIRNNHDLIVGIALAVPGLIAAGIAAITFGKALSFLATVTGPAFYTLSAGITAAGVALSGVIGLTGVFTTAVNIAVGAIQAMFTILQTGLGATSIFAILLYTTSALASNIVQLSIATGKFAIDSARNLGQFFSWVKSSFAKTTEIAAESIKTALFVTRDLTAAFLSAGTSVADAGKMLFKMGIGAAQVAAILGGMTGDIVEWTDGLLKANIAVTTIARGMANAGMSIFNIGQALTAAGASASQVIEGFTALNMTAAGIGYNAAKIGMSVTDMASGMIKAGATIFQVQEAIVSFGSTTAAMTESAARTAAEAAEATARATAASAAITAEVTEAATRVAARMAEAAQATVSTVALTASEAAQIAARTVGNAMRLGHGVLGAMDAVLDSTVSLTQGAKAIADVFGNTSEVFGEAIQTIVSLGGQFSDVADICAGFGKTVSDAFSVILKSADSLMGVGTILRDIGWNINDVAGMLLRFGSNSTQVAEILVEMGYSATEATSAVLSVIGDVAEATTEMASSAVSALSEVAEAATETTAEVALGIASATAEVASEASKAAAKTVISLGAILPFLLKIGAFLLPIILAIGGLYTGWMMLKNAFWGLVDLAQKVFQTIVAGLKNIGVGFLNMFRTIGNSGVQAFIILGEAAAGWFKTIQGFLAALLPEIKMVFGQIYASYKAVVSAMQSGEMTLAMEIVRLEAIRQLLQVEEFAQSLLQNFGKAIPVVMKTFATAWSILWNGFTDGILDFLNVLKHETNIMFADIMAKTALAIDKYTQSLDFIPDTNFYQDAKKSYDKALYDRAVSNINRMNVPEEDKQTMRTALETARGYILSRNSKILEMSKLSKTIPSTDTDHMAFAGGMPILMKWVPNPEYERRAKEVKNLNKAMSSDNRNWQFATKAWGENILQPELLGIKPAAKENTMEKAVKSIQEFATQSVKALENLELDVVRHLADLLGIPTAGKDRDGLIKEIGAQIQDRQKQADLLQKLNDGKSKATGPWDKGENTRYNNAKAQVSEIQAEIDKLRDIGVGADNPEIKKLTEEIEKLRKVMEEEKKQVKRNVAGGIPGADYFQSRMDAINEMIETRTLDEIKKRETETGKMLEMEERNKIRREMAKPFETDMARLTRLASGNVIFKDLKDQKIAQGIDPMQADWDARREIYNSEMAQINDDKKEAKRVLRLAIKSKDANLKDAKITGDPEGFFQSEIENAKQIMNDEREEIIRLNKRAKEIERDYGLPKTRTNDLAELYTRAQRSITTFGATSGWDIIRGAKGKENEVLSELQTQTGYLKNIEETVGIMGE